MSRVNFTKTNSKSNLFGRRRAGRGGLSGFGRDGRKSAGRVDFGLMKRAALIGSVFPMAMLVTVLVSHSTTPVVDTNATINPTGYSISVTSGASNNNGPINFGTVVTTPDGQPRSVLNPVTVTSTSPSGYKLYISMNNSNTNGNRLMKDGSSTTDYISPASGTYATPATLGTNTWGYAVAGAGNFDASYTEGDVAMGAKWAGIPLLNNAQMIDSATSATTKTVNVYYGMWLTSALASGSYSNTITYTALAEASTLSAQGGEMTVSPTTSTTSGGGTLTLTTSLKGTKTAATFAVSDLGSVTAAVGGTDCPVTSTTISANATLVVKCTAPAKSAGTYNATVSYTYLDRKTYTMSSAITYSVPATWFSSTPSNMQNMTKAICNSATTPSASATTIVTSASAYTNPETQVPQMTLTDSRNSVSYQIRKLADGNCWMAQNLRLQAGLTMNSSNTDNPASGFSMTSSSSWGTTNPPTTAYVNTTGTASNGYWYNWNAATANTGNNITSGDASGSICPKNWGLPTRTQFNTLLSTYSVASNGYGAKLTANPISMPYAGYWGDSSSGYVGSLGYYWSRTANNANYAYDLNFGSGYADTYSLNRSSGFSVRCLVK